MSKIIGGIILVLIGIFGLIQVSANQANELSPGVSRIFNGERGAMAGISAMNDKSSSDSVYDMKKLFFAAAIISGLFTIYQGYIISTKKEDSDERNELHEKTEATPKTEKTQSDEEKLTEMPDEAKIIISKLEKYKYKFKSYDSKKSIWTLTGTSSDFDCNYSELKNLLRNFE